MPKEYCEPMITGRLLIFRRWMTAAVFTLSLALPAAAHAQVIVVVNGSPITEFDIQQRTRLLATSGHNNPARKEVVGQLIDDRIKITRARGYGLVLSAAEIDAAFGRMAARQHITPEQFTQVLQRSGITPGAVKDRIRADMTWSQLVRGKFASSLTVGKAEIADAIKNNDAAFPTVDYLYTLYPIIIVAAQGSSEATLKLKRNEAENLRSRFQDCKQGLLLARALRDVAVREPINTSSADLPAPLREMLGNMQVGHLTHPEVTNQGLQMFAVCSRTTSKADSPAEREARNQLVSKRFEAESKKYLEELRNQALIVYK